MYYLEKEFVLYNQILLLLLLPYHHLNLNTDCNNSLRLAKLLLIFKTIVISNT